MKWQVQQNIPFAANRLDFSLLAWSQGRQLVPRRVISERVINLQIIFNQLQTSWELAGRVMIIPWWLISRYACYVPWLGLKGKGTSNPTGPTSHFKDHAYKYTCMPDHHRLPDLLFIYDWVWYSRNHCTLRSSLDQTQETHLSYESLVFSIKELV